MKYFVYIFAIIFCFSFTEKNTILGPGHFYGSWKMEVKEGSNAITYIKIFTPKHFVFGGFESEGNKFVQAGGGIWTMTADGIKENYEFNSQNPELVGQTLSYAFNSSHEEVPLTLWIQKAGKKEKQVWHQIDEGDSPLFGTWRITQRQRDGTMTAMRQGARKTWKVLSGNRFQWAAFNVDTKAFMGTGGGTFETKDGKYTEKIDFFSRDNSRVGMSLEFDYNVKDKDWHHKGYSSKGDPIYEIWSNQD